MSHNKFIARHASTTESVLDLILDFLDEHDVTPCSLGISRVNGGYLAIIGYDEIPREHNIGFVTFTYEVDDPLDLEEFEAGLNHEEEGLLEVLCHAVTMEDGYLKIITMNEE